MAVEVAPLSVTYPSEHTTCLVVGASWRRQRRAYRAGGPVLNCARCRGNTNLAQDPQKMVRRETPLHPRIHKMLEALTQRGEGSSGLRDEDESWDVTALWHWSHSSPVVGSHIGVCVMTTFLPVHLPWWLCWTVQWVFFLKERGVGVCPSVVVVPWGVIISLLSIRRLQVMAAFFLPNLYHTLIASLQSDDGRG